MKIISILILSFLSFSISILAEEDCSYLESTNSGRAFVDDSKCSFGHHYNIHLCREFQPITKEAIEYVQSIKKTKWKTVRELVTKMGNVLCTWSFGECGEKAFADRYAAACDIAREKAIDDALKCLQKESRIIGGKIEDDRLTIQSNDTTFKESYTKCIPLSEELLSIFKDVSEQEIWHYHGKIIESSSAQYLVPSRDLMQNLSNTMGTIIKKIWSVARSFEGFIRNVYNTWFTVGNG